MAETNRFPTLAEVKNANGTILQQLWLPPAEWESQLLQTWFHWRFLASATTTRWLVQAWPTLTKCFWHFPSLKPSFSLVDLEVYSLGLRFTIGLYGLFVLYLCHFWMWSHNTFLTNMFQAGVAATNCQQWQKFANIPNELCDRHDRQYAHLYPSGCGDDGCVGDPVLRTSDCHFFLGRGLRFLSIGITRWRYFLSEASKLLSLICHSVHNWFILQIYLSSFHQWYSKLL